MTAVLRARPQSNEFAEYYGRYIAQAPEGDPVAQLREEGAALDAVLRRIPESRGGHRYAEGKWSVREVIGHLIDAERIFAYRALRIARGDATPLPGFEENDYVRTSGSELRRSPMWSMSCAQCATPRCGCSRRSPMRPGRAAAWRVATKSPCVHWLGSSSVTRCIMRVGCGRIMGWRDMRLSYVSREP
jgi:Mycothiol maleylpyruvate isomerase N-terminal domain.